MSRERPGGVRSLLTAACAVAALLASSLLGSVLPAAAAATAPSGGSPRPQATVAQGILRGQDHDGAQEFLG
ncbi:hypothetical protein ACFQ78_30545, partial [Streptomyces sp. NPDC056519]|uniref:hypothetical protein n=1 Tax=Streptomyces sp. NPDC056519 TaxID=3345849 RepID=UPI0036C6276F